MFIPSWLLILIVVIGVSVLWPSFWTELRNLALALFLILALVSMPATLYFAYQRDTPMALAASRLTPTRTSARNSKRRPPGR